MRSKTTGIFFVSLSLFAAFAGGCATANYTNTKGSDTQLIEPQNIFKFSDVPIPAGFKPMAKDSYSFESSGVRVAVLKYRGKGNRDLINGFFKEQMAIYKWNLLNMVEYGDTIMNFEKENETCIITLAPRRGTIIASISLGPKSPKAAAKKTIADTYKRSESDNELLK